MLARRALVLLLLPLAAASEYDSCKRPVSVWAGFDQGKGISQPHAVTYHDTNIYIAGYAMGNLSFHTAHSNGNYTDHAGASATADTHADVTNHFETGSSEGSVYETDHTSQYGMDAIIYKVTLEGKPVKVFGVDIVPADEIFNESSTNGIMGGFAEFYGIDAFDQPDMVVAAGLYRGKLTYPTAAGSETLINEKDGGYSRVSTAPHLLWGGANGFVIKVDMASGEAVWATDDGLLTEDVSNRYYLRNVATTADGDVLATADERLKDGSTVGKLVKFDGEDGSKQWSVTYATVTAMYGLDGDADEETVYVLGEFEGEDIDPFGTGAKLTSKKGGAVIAALDVRGSEGPVGKWAIQCDKGDGNSVKAVGAHLYVTGELSGPTTLGDCSLTGEAGGYLAKLNKADGTCVWAKDVPSGRGATAVSDGASVWAFYYDDEKRKYGEQIIYPKAHSSDVFAAKYSAEDGAGLWATSIGGTGKDRFADAAITPAGPVLAAYAQSEEISFGGVSITNLQHARAAAERGGEVGSDWGPNRGGETAAFSLLISKTDELPPCLSSCPSGSLSAADTTVTAGMCYAHTECLDDGSASAYVPCFECKPAADGHGSQVLSGPVTVDEDRATDYCYIGDECIPEGTMAPAYKGGNDPSVCEWCVPSVAGLDWSLVDGYALDRDFAEQTEPGQVGWCRGPSCAPDGKPGKSNALGLRFEEESNGCLKVHEVVLPPDDPSDALSAALANTPGSMPVGEMATAAIAAVRSATDENQGVELAWYWYFGNCDTKAANTNVCADTPSSTAHSMAKLRWAETALHYGHAMADMKVSMSLSLLADKLAEGSDEVVADLKKDAVAQMLLPFYQCAIQAAYDMDESEKKTVAQADGAACWRVIDGAAGAGFKPDDRAVLDSMFTSSKIGEFNYCSANASLLQNLPAASHRQYANFVRKGTLAIGGWNATAGEWIEGIKGDSNVHVTIVDVANGQPPKQCTFPPPPSPSAPPPPPSPSSKLSSGEIAGIAVGGAIGGLIILGLIYLSIRAVRHKGEKPIFTCLMIAPCVEGGQAKAPAPAPAAV